MRRRQKDFRGCLRCRARKIKCDEAAPNCIRCRKIGKECPGYGISLIWVPPNQEVSKHQGRRGPCPTATWKGWDTLTLKEVDHIIEELDRPPTSRAENRVRRTTKALFSILELQNAYEPHLSNQLDFFGPGWNRTSRYLFHHYINYVAPLMLPVSSAPYSNPWATYYTVLASHSMCVRYALLSQSAAHLWHLRNQGSSDMDLCALKYHGTALAHLRMYLSHKESSVESFEIIIATILTLIMAEIYHGYRQDWRCHLSGAVEVALSSTPSSPWLKSEMAWLVAQSLTLLCLRTKIDDNTLLSGIVGAEKDGSPIRPYSKNTFLTQVSLRRDYGFTVGINYELATSLTKCADIVAAWDCQPSTFHDYLEVEALSHQLSNMAICYPQPQYTLTECDRQADYFIRGLHNHIFALGTLICLQRRTINPPPSSLEQYTNSVFECIKSFMSWQQNSTLISGAAVWPVFHAAVELYTESTQQKCRDVWLNDLKASAIGNRKQICAVVEEVWRIRRRRAEVQTSRRGTVQIRVQAEAEARKAVEAAAGNTVVDWTTVAVGMEIDLLLI